jgi:regulatory protein
MNTPKKTGGVSHPDACYKAKQDAFRFLSYRARSQAEVRRRLQKSYSFAVIEQVLGALEAQGYLDDAAFAREWRRHREERRPRGQGVLKQELLRLGVEPGVIQEALAGFDAPGNAYRAALVLAQRLSGTDYLQFRKRVWSHLQRRGFDHSIISDVVSQLWRRLADPEHRVVDAHPQEQQRENVESEGVDGPAYEEG